MDREVIAVFRDVADRSPEEREAYYTRRGVPPALRAEVESLLQFDGATLDTADARVAAAAYAFLQDGTHSSSAPGTRVRDNPYRSTDIAARRTRPGRFTSTLFSTASVRIQHSRQPSSFASWRR
jgi:hypothetical protein